MKDKLIPSSKIYLGISTVTNAGRGVFAAVDIAEGEIIETCPVIEAFDEGDYSHLKQTKLRNYYFMWGGNDRAAVCLGFGSLYNHSYDPNATYEKDIAGQLISFVAIRPITQHAEITVNYNYGVQTTKARYG